MQRGGALRHVQQRIARHVPSPFSSRRAATASDDGALAPRRYVVAFEVSWDRIVGVDYINMLCSDGRMVLEAHHVVKRIFLTVCPCICTAESAAAYRLCSGHYWTSHSPQCYVRRTQAYKLRCFMTQMRDAREFYDVPASPRPRSAASPARESESPPRSAGRDQIGPSMAAAATERRPRHAARRRLQLDTDANGRRTVTAAVSSSRNGPGDGNGGQLPWHGAVPPTLRTTSAATGRMAVVGSPLQPADHAGEARQSPSAARKQLSDTMRQRAGARAADGHRFSVDGYDGGQVLCSGSEGLLPRSYPGNPRTARAQASASTSLQDVMSDSTAATSAPTAVTPTTGGLAGGSDPGRPSEAQSRQLLDSPCVGAHQDAGGSPAALDRNVFHDAGSVGAESPGSSDAEGPTGGLLQHF